MHFHFLAQYICTYILHRNLARLREELLGITEIEAMFQIITGSLVYSKQDGWICVSLRASNKTSYI